jgi:hypothetical protein
LAVIALGLIGEGLASAPMASSNALPLPMYAAIATGSPVRA